MKHWSIPAKTFLVGEYAALLGQSAIILTTNPSFELRQVKEPGLHGIHPQSPAGRWWTQHPTPSFGLAWHDPYQGLGGLGASSAQFLGVYQAWAESQAITIETESLLKAYQSVTSTAGTPPSGYDVLAQWMRGCVYINRQNHTLKTLSTQDHNTWPFTDIGYILIHTQEKLSTHEHLQSLALSTSMPHLVELVEHARYAFETQSSQDLIMAVQGYHQALSAQGWVAPHTQQLIQRLNTESQALAIKGCGAMGADVLLLLMRQEEVQSQANHLATTGWQVLTTN
ncbi:MAG: hypothetical protein NXI01_03785 [Gammaproteobacteria bacterium]|nr:hypothetical protein [Gammaproteobacteria bacterium]